jgi:peptidoglycan hydrolase-like protein with peptidoglycan-binding domain
MTKTTKKILLGVGTVILVVYLYGVLNKMLRKPSQEKLNLLDMDLVLEKGSKGSEVAELQRILKDELGLDVGTSGTEGDGIDGDFGTMTENALFQAKGVKKITLKDMYNEKK